MNHLKNKNKVLFLFGLLGLSLISSISLVSVGICASTEDVSETRVIPVLSYLSYAFEMEADDKLNVEFQVTVGGNLDIDVYVVDSANYEKLADWESFYYKIRLERVVESDFEFEAQSRDTYYIVFSNAFSILTSKTVEIDIEFIQDTPLIDLLIIILLVGGISIVGIYIVKKQSKKEKFVADFHHQRDTPRTPPNQPNITPIPPETPERNTHTDDRTTVLDPSEDRFCPGCGHALEAGTNFCTHCGKKR